MIQLTRIREQPVLKYLLNNPLKMMIRSNHHQLRAQPMRNTVQNFDEQFKVIIVGSSGVGKSAILIRFADDKFEDDLLRPTIGVDFRFKTINVNNKKVKIQIWDTAGQEGFRTIVSAYYKGADAIIVVYDHLDTNTFTDIEEFWSNEIKENREEHCVIMVLANKCDLKGEKTVNEVRIEGIKQKLGASLYFEVSAKQNQKIELAFSELCKELMNRKAGIMRNKRKGVKLGSGEEDQEGEKKKCCK